MTLKPLVVAIRVNEWFDTENSKLNGGSGENDSTKTYRKRNTLLHSSETHSKNGQ